MSASLVYNVAEERGPEVPTQKEQRRRAQDYTARKTVHEGQLKRRRRDNVLAIIGVVVVCVVATFGQIWYVQSNEVRVPDPSLADGATWTGEIVLNDIPLEIELDGAAAPQGVSSFVYDTERGYYADKTCHRLTTGEGFSVLQCGSVDGTGAGDPNFMYGPIENAPADDIYVAGTIAIARAGNDAQSNGHQFFIVYEDTMIPSDEAGGYTVIGKVTSGLETLNEEITSKGVDLAAQTPTDGQPLVPVTITSAEVSKQSDQ
ncbi:peptidylprolyl isomerase [Humidisolicoccus flavus]|uniref:peptidylprolyl isomerase n=1 Tax=Humidisolicoccus flavus TaxID=3111414 RepID=UPI00324572FA